jgi:hypothetical protein
LVLIHVDGHGHEVYNNLERILRLVHNFILFRLAIFFVNIVYRIYTMDEFIICNLDVEIKVKHQSRASKAKNLHSSYQ